MDEEYNPEKESWVEYQQRIIGEYTAMNMDNIISKYIKHKKEKL